jgi:Holliday junction DNA helicase RuvA
MIGLLEGIYHSGVDSNIIIMVNGVGYRVEGSSTLVSAPMGSKVTAYIYTHVREDTLKLFGFSTEGELKMFELLIGVNGVGPKGALAIISTLGERGIEQAVLTKDVAMFQSVSGIGRRGAEKIILDLKSKIKGNAETDIPMMEDGNSQRDEVERALTSLGYTAYEVRKVLPEVKYSDDIGQTIKSALQLLRK